MRQRIGDRIVSKLLFNSRPLVVDTDLAILVGVNEAIVLQQVHYWIENTKNQNKPEVERQHFHDGRWWVFNTYDEWQKQFPFWSMSTIKRIFSKLESNNLLISGNFNKFGYDRTKWYTIDYVALENLENSHSVKMTQSKVSSCTNAKCQNDTTNTIDYTENTKKITGLNGAKTEFCTSILEKEIEKAFRETEVPFNEDIEKAIIYFYKAYKNTFWVEHPRINQKAMNGVIIRFSEVGLDLDYEQYVILIDEYFSKECYKADYNICHFATEGILQNLYYETIY